MLLLGLPLLVVLFMLLDCIFLSLDQAGFDRLLILLVIEVIVELRLNLNDGLALGGYLIDPALALLLALE